MLDKIDSQHRPIRQPALLRQRVVCHSTHKSAIQQPHRRAPITAHCPEKKLAPVRSANLALDCVKGLTAVDDDADSIQDERKQDLQKKGPDGKDRRNQIKDWDTWPPKK